MKLPKFLANHRFFRYDRRMHLRFIGNGAVNDI